MSSEQDTTMGSDELSRMLSASEALDVEMYSLLSLSGFLCARHSMTQRSMNATQDQDRCGGPSGAAANSG
jgi:hypothetical protein